MTRPLPFDLAPRPALGREDFLAGTSNAEALAWIERWPAWTGPGLALVGPAGSGKTHLAAIWRARAGAVVVDRAALAADVADALGAARHALLEDADRAVAERPLLHLHNLVVERGGNLLLTAREAPSRWAIALPDLRSRLGALPVATLGPPDDALLAAVLVKLFADRQLRPAPDLVAFLVPRLERSFAALGRAVGVLDEAALAEQRAITVPWARDALTRAGLIV